MDDRKRCIAIVGTGCRARTRVRCWQYMFGARMELVIAARDRSKAEEFAREYEVEKSMTIDEMLADPSIHLADLCVGTRAQRDLCIRAAEAGKSVSCTQPLSMYWGQGLAEDASASEVASVDPRVMYAGAVADAVAMVAACRSARTHLFYGENWCYAQPVVCAAALMSMSKSTILEMRGGKSHPSSCSLSATDWRLTGGGPLLRLGAHPIGAMLWLKRIEAERTCSNAIAPRHVSAETMQRKGAPVESCGICTITFDDGSIGIAVGSDQMLGGTESHLSVLSSTGRLECAISPSTHLCAHSPGEGSASGEYTMEKMDHDGGWTKKSTDRDWTSGHRGLVLATGNVLRNNMTPNFDGQLGLDVVRVIYAAYVSAREGRRIKI